MFLYLINKNLCIMPLVLMFQCVVAETTTEKPVERKVFALSKFNFYNLTNISFIIINIWAGVYYDDTYTNVPDLVAYSADIIDRILKTSSFRFEYSIKKVYQNSTFKLTKTCRKFSNLKLFKIKIKKYFFLI